MSKQVIICILIVFALSSVVVQSKKSVSSYDKNEEISPRIVNGTNARQGQHPWSIAVFQKDDFVCMAALITPKTALTVSHCFFTEVIEGNETFADRDDFFEFHGKIGDIRLRHADPVQFRRLILHEDFVYENLLNDIALLILTKRVELTERIKTIALPRTHKVYRGIADVVGWGSCTKGSAMTPDNLQVVKMNIMDPTRCGTLFKQPLQKETYICTWAERKGPCDGDSGAPLILTRSDSRMSIGVLLGDLPNSSIGQADSYASTGYYAEWIIANAEGQITFIS